MAHAEGWLRDEPREERGRQASFDSGIGPSTKTEGSLSSETRTTRKVRAL